VEELGELQLVATAPAGAGERLLALEGDLVARPTRYSLQVDEDLHVDVPAATPPADVRERHPWRFLNHSCAPNAVVRDRAVFALRPIRPGDEITLDYNATEWDMSWPFPCRCGVCDGAQIAGFRHLDPAARERLRPHLSPHLRRHLDAPGA